MTDYTKNTNFTAKDGLTSGDPNKVIKGSEFDAEFDEIATASATKANKAIPSAAGDFAALSVTGDLVDSGKTPPSGEVVGTTDAQPLTNKTINSADNTLTINLSSASVTGTTAQFNTALSDGDFATLAGTEELTNKTLTSPAINGATIDGTTTVDGITATNLVDKSASETITGSWTFSGGLSFSWPAAAAGNYIEAQTEEKINSSDSSLTKHGEIKVNRSGTYTVRIWLKSAGGSSVSGRIYVNGSATGTARSTTDTSTGTFWNEDIAVSAGDLVQLYTGYGSDTQVNSRMALMCSSPVLAGALYTTEENWV